LLRLLAALIAAPGLFSAAPAAARPQLWLPTPPDEVWTILQGYACGSHNKWDRYSLDMVSAAGRTRDAPVRAAADGAVFIWVKRSGTLILEHGGGFYTMYTHMASAAVTEPGRVVARGAVIGTVGDRGSPGTPHLHFTAFTAEGGSARNRRSVPLAFAEGYDLPETGGCNQHGGATVVAASDTTPPIVTPLPAPLHAPAATPTVLAWQPGADEGSGVSGYRVYLGPDPNGASDWFVPAPEIQTPPLAPGSYLLRLQPLDYAGNVGQWTTVGTLVVEG
jgi:murein DD-endopeptidase MepM/ murein hydrolase activator NlpD